MAFNALQPLPVNPDLPLHAVAHISVPFAATTFVKHQTPERGVINTTLTNSCINFGEMSVASSELPMVDMRAPR